MMIWELPNEDEEIPSENQIGELTLYSEEIDLDDVVESLEITEDVDSEMVEFRGLAKTTGGLEEQHDLALTSSPAVDSSDDYRFSSPVSAFTPISTVTTPQGTITLGEPMIGKLPNQFYPQKDYYAALIPFTLEKPRIYRRYKELNIDIKFVTNNTIAHDMYPRSVEEKQTVETDVTISPTLNFRGVDLSAVEVSFKIPFTFIKPVITAKGHRTNNPRWTFVNNSASYGNKAISVILEVPKGVKVIHGSFQCQAVVGRLSTRTITDPFWFEFNVSDVPTLPIESAS